jgi:hypothetical protein
MSTMFMKLFSLLNFFDEMKDYVDSLRDDEWISNVVQTEFWKKKNASCELKEDEIAFPLYIYFDDFEPLNALGSHSSAYKLGGVYVYIPCVPPAVQSELDFIFLAMLFFSYDRTIYGNKRVFAPLISQLNELQDVGIPIVHHKYKRVKLVSTLLIGDNLGLNSMMGFVESFNSIYYCRFCRHPKENMRKLVYEDPKMRRTIENYHEDCQKKMPQLTGVKEASVWNDLKHFHVVDNRSVDSLHDFLEGICKVVLLQILKNFIFERKYFSVATFNKRLKQHDFGPLESNTNIALLCVTAKKKKKKTTRRNASNETISDSKETSNLTIKTSGSEMKTLFIHLPFIIGDYVEEGIDEWKVYLLCREIFNLVNRKTVHKDTHILLKTLVTEFETSLLQTFDIKLTPKCHFLTHYPNVMKDIGPLPHVSAIRFESFHRIFKATLNTISCRKNLLKSCSFKVQMRLANFFFKFKSFRKDIETDKSKKLPLEALPRFQTEIQLPEFVRVTKRVTCNSVDFKVGCVIQTSIGKDEIPQFCFIENIILLENEIFFLCQTLINNGFNDHYQAFSVEFDDYRSLKKIDSKFNKCSYVYHGVNNNNFVIWD